MHDSSADAELISSLRDQALTAIAPLVAGSPNCALVGFPNHNNSGDNAIWLGELQLLELLDIEPAYQCDDVSYNRGDLIEAVPEGPVLIHGGGNYGDLWPHQQSFREQVMRDFPHRKVIQLPQTVTFLHGASVVGHRRLLQDRAQPVTILCRDEASLRFVAEDLGMEPVLCPDTALFLDLQAPANPKVDVVVNERTDHESSGSHELVVPGITVEHLDWLPAPGSRDLRRASTVRIRTTARAIAATSRGESAVARTGRALPMVAARRLAERRVANACRLLSRGKVVVTDRLHGHILSMLMGIPHVIRDTQHRKVVDFHETFTSTSRTTLVAERPDEIEHLVERLLTDAADRG